MNDFTPEQSPNSNRVLSFFKNRFIQLLPVILLITWLITANTPGNRVIPVLPGSSEIDIVQHSDNMKSIDTPYLSETKVTTFTQTDSSIATTFSLGSCGDFPYAGILIDTWKSKKLQQFIDISHMDNIEFDLAVHGGQQTVNLYFSEFVDGLTDLSKEMSWRVYEYPINSQDSLEHYRIPLEEFRTNPWWFQMNNVTESELPPTKREKIVNIVFENGNYELPDTSISIEVKNIRFTKNTTRLNTILGSSLFIYVIMVLLVRKVGFARLMGPIVIPYRQLEVTSYLDDETKIIENYIKDHFTDSELSVKKLCKETGITHVKLQAILKKQFNTTFRQYLNRIKIAEAKRLLQETDRQVTDIAYCVGYKNVTHFNRIFKEMEGISPIQFRKS